MGVVEKISYWINMARDSDNLTIVAACMNDTHAGWPKIWYVLKQYNRKYSMLI